MPARTLSEPEFDAIKARILDAAPPNLREEDFNRYIGPAMASAIGEAENSSAPVTGSAIARYAAGAWKNLNPMGIVSAIAHPVDTLDAITNAITAEKAKARDLASQGRYVEAAGHAVGSMVLPAVTAGESIAAGDVAGGLGQGMGLVAGVEAPRALAAARVPIGDAVGAVGRGAEAVATSKPAQYAAGFGAYHRIMAGDVPGTMLAVGAPKALALAGQGLRHLGDVIRGAAPAALSDLELARQEVAAGRLHPSILKGLERQVEFEAAKARRAASVTPAVPPAADTTPPAARPGERPAQAPVTAAAEPIVAESGKMQLTAPEMKEFTRLIQRGMRLPDALETVKAMRDLASRLGGASASEVAKAVAQRNATGQW